MDRVVQSSGTEWRYHLVGEGNQCLVVLSGSLGATNRIAGFLAEQLTDYRLIVPEYAAVGTIRECLDALDLILDREKIERFALLGSSFGGVIAQVFARRHPDRVTNLILAGTSPPDMDRVRSHQRALKLLPWIPVSLIRALLKILLHGMLRRVKNRVWLQEYSRLISSLSKKDISSRYRVAMDLDRSYRFDPQDSRFDSGRGEGPHCKSDDPLAVGYDLSAREFSCVSRGRTFRNDDSHGGMDPCGSCRLDFIVCPIRLLKK
jgi:pimeloyl-ACP methyl ester carboxylesterase